MLAFILVLVGAVAGCASPVAEKRLPQAEATASRFEYARVVMGSRARIVLYADREPDAAHAAREAFREMDRLNMVLSDYTDASEAMRICAAPHATECPISADLLDVLQKSRLVHRASAGAFDPTLGALTQLWRASFKSNQLPSLEARDEARARSGFHRITLDPESSTVELLVPGLRFDFGAIGKGYAADRALRTLGSLGFTRALVDIGGDMAIGDPPPGAAGWRIGATDDRTDHPRTLVLANTGLATSGDRYRSITLDGVRYSHILDPRTGLGLRSAHAVTVVAPQAWLADALASAASVLGPADSARLTERWPDAEFIWFAPQAERPEGDATPPPDRADHPPASRADTRSDASPGP
ncbi:MAG: FAD:protein FMN transferase [Phycisphaerales bacterium JB059]